MGSPDDVGFELVAWIRREHPEVRLVLAGNVSKATEKAGDLCEEGPTVSKPYDHSVVLDRIRRQMAARDQSRPKAAKG